MDGILGILDCGRTHNSGQIRRLRRCCLEFGPRFRLKDGRGTQNPGFQSASPRTSGRTLSGAGQEFPTLFLSEKVGPIPREVHSNRNQTPFEGAPEHPIGELPKGGRPCLWQDREGPLCYNNFHSTTGRPPGNRTQGWHVSLLQTLRQERDPDKTVEWRQVLLQP